MKVRLFAACLTLTVMAGPALAAECPAVLAHELPKLRAKETLDLCERYRGKALVVVNTASFCGFAPQFKGLEALYQRYKDEGLEVLGVPSDDFFQESEDAAETAEVCYVNYGVTFQMTQTQPVRGRDATPLFKVLAEQAGGAPRWNFYKYVVDREGRVVDYFSSKVEPDDPELIAAVEKALEK
ncbi:glutathione peroxidase [Pseudomonas sp. PS1]|uniref:Glutathione peroxidase n=1 Tax=Stutzerimonas marianensis TaxID=2929513 RepID=A0A9X1W4W1_9GAMM|nr:glutathione peroxidase [Pseudomonas marianensis]MCJ0974385.1 glutathione peroxidase [Pseudomonas marianensis]